MPAVILFVASAVWFFIRSRHGIHFASFGDESGHFLGARAIRAGDRLYRDFIDAHGPLVFMLAQACGVVLGWHEPISGRWAIVAIVSLAAMSATASPIFGGPVARLWSGALFLALVSAPWLVQALNMVNYHVLGGALVSVVFALLVLPAWFHAHTKAWHDVVSGICLAFLCGDSYSLAPSAFLLFASAALFHRANMSAAPAGTACIRLIAGFAAGCLVLLVWMLIYGDLVGYLVFHVINNQVNYARYGSYGWRVALRSFIPSLAPGQIVQSSAAIACLASVILLTLTTPWRATRRPATMIVAVAMFCLAVVMLNFRGGFGFQDGSFLVASIMLLALALSFAAQRHGMHGTLQLAWPATAAFAMLISTVEIANRHAMSSPGILSRQQLIAWPQIRLAEYDGFPIVRRLHQVLQPGERILVLVYNPDFFLYAGLLPIRKFHEYLPWEADYARNPWFGRDRDLCREVEDRPPPAIVYDGWKVWGLYAPETFMPCIPAILAKSYVADAVPKLFIRKDRVPAQ